MNENLLIKNTTQEQREKIVADSLGIIAGQCDGCASGIIDMYDDYIYGRKELSEINAEFSARSGGSIRDNGSDDSPKGPCAYSGL